MIVWIASYPRSGNTLVRTILKHCFGQRTYSIYDDRHDIGAHAATSSAIGHANMGAEAHEFLAQARVCKEPVFVKSHELPDDNCKAIYVIREGLSTCVSYSSYLSRFAEPATFADVTLGAVNFGSWSAHFKAWLERPADLLVLRYESLVDSLDESLAAIETFLGTPAVSRELPTFAELHAMNPAFFRSGSNAKNALSATPSEQLLFEMLHGRVNRELGYSQHVELDSTLQRCGELISASTSRMMRESANIREAFLLADADRTARSGQVGQLETLLHASEADRSARFEQVVALTKQVEELQSRVEAAVRPPASVAGEGDSQVPELQAELEIMHRRFAEAEHDRSQRLRQMHQLEAQLAESEADRANRLTHIQSLSRMVADAEQARAELQEQIARLSDQIAKEGARAEVLQTQLADARQRLEVQRSELEVVLSDYAGLRRRVEERLAHAGDLVGQGEGGALLNLLSLGKRLAAVRTMLAEWRAEEESN